MGSSAKIDCRQFLATAMPVSSEVQRDLSHLAGSHALFSPRIKSSPNVVGEFIQLVFVALIKDGQGMGNSLCTKCPAQE